MSRIFCIFLLVLILCFSEAIGCSADTLSNFEKTELTDLAALTLRVDEETPEARKAAAKALETLDEIHLSPPLALSNELPHLFTTVDGRGVLAGDFAGDGTIAALVQLGSEGDHPLSNGKQTSVAGIAFVRWEADRWVLHGLWAIQPQWYPDDGFTKVHPPASSLEKAFRSERPVGESLPWVLVAGPVATDDYQIYYVLRFDRTRDNLRLLARLESNRKPLLLSDGWAVEFSAHRRGWTRYYSHFDHDRFEMLAVYEDVIPTNPDNRFLKATCFGGQDDRSQDFKLIPFDSSQKDISRWRIERNGRNFALIKIFWHPNILTKIVRTSAPEEAYLFGKLTGVPRKIYVESLDDPDITEPVLEKVAKIRVSGGSQAKRMFGTKR